jgi:pimeloyl-ACP methyl ester carboxylesterase
MARRVALVVVSWWLVACNVVSLQQAHIEHGLREQGLAPTRIVTNDAVVWAWVGGSGKPLLLLHGFGASGVWQWYKQIPAFAGRRVIVPDLLWFGDSFGRTRDYSIDHQVRAMRALCRELGVESLDAMGVSYGGLVAYELASAHPELVARLVMVDSPGRAYTKDDYAALRARFGADIGAVLVPADANGVSKLFDLAYAEPPSPPGWVLPQIYDAFYRCHRTEQAALLDTLLGHIDELAARPDPRAPTLIVWGREDPVFPLAIGERLAARLEGRAKLAVIDHAKHAPNVEHPEEFNAIVTKFLSPPRGQ